MIFSVQTKHKKGRKKKLKLTTNCSIYPMRVAELCKAVLYVFAM